MRIASIRYRDSIIAWSRPNEVSARPTGGRATRSDEQPRSAERRDAPAIGLDGDGRVGRPNVARHRPHRRCDRRTRGGARPGTRRRGRGGSRKPSKPSRRSATRRAPPERLDRDRLTYSPSIVAATIVVGWQSSRRATRRAISHRGHVTGRSPTSGSRGADVRPDRTRGARPPLTVHRVGSDDPTRRVRRRSPRIVEIDATDRIASGTSRRPRRHRRLRSPNRCRYLAEGSADAQTWSEVARALHHAEAAEPPANTGIG